MKKYTSLISFTILLLSNVLAQQHDNNWVTSRGNNGGNLLSFDAYDVTVDFIFKTAGFWSTHITMSDSTGNLMFSSNGIEILDKNYESMENTDSMAMEVLRGYDTGGSPIIQGALALPLPDGDNEYYFFYPDLDFSVVDAPDSVVIAPHHLYMARIDMNANNGLGKVVEKNTLIIDDTLSTGGFQAVKHANGRDWWIIIPEKRTNAYYTMLFNPNGVDTIFKQHIGIVWPNGYDISTQTCFSSNGEIYSRFYDITGLQIFNFDRCVGLFSNPILIDVSNTESITSGLAISKDSRYIYASIPDTLWQLDLKSSDIKASQTVIGAYDGFANPGSSAFNTIQIAPDGKLYMNNIGFCKNYHIIHHPEREGLDCEFEQHGLDLPAISRIGLPNNPNYRLGPLDGSPCDTLGLDNMPQAAYRYELLDSFPYQVDFTDLSYYEPTDWSWDFGDPTSGLLNSSTKQYPQHSYTSLGVYEVCLTVSNQNGQHSYCRTLFLGVTATAQPERSSFCSDISVAYRMDELFVKTEKSGILRCYDALGRTLGTFSLGSGQNRRMLAQIPKGICFWVFEDAAGRGLCSGRVFVP